MSNEEIGIAALAERHGLTHRALRFYEGRGLIEAARRGRGRVYDARAAARVALICQATDMGFTLAEVKRMLKDTPAGTPILALSAERASKQLEIMSKRALEAAGAVTALREFARGSAGAP